LNILLIQALCILLPARGLDVLVLPDQSKCLLNIP
jgi:hypothetical protein